MLTTRDLTVEKINALLKTAAEFADGKTLKAATEIYVSNLFF